MTLDHHHDGRAHVWGPSGTAPAPALRAGDPSQPASRQLGGWSQGCRARPPPGTDPGRGQPGARIPVITRPCAGVFLFPFPPPTSLASSATRPCASGKDAAKSSPPVPAGSHTPEPLALNGTSSPWTPGRSVSRFSRLGWWPSVRRGLCTAPRPIFITSTRKVDRAARIILRNFPPSLSAGRPTSTRRAGDPVDEDATSAPHSAFPGRWSARFPPRGRQSALATSRGGVLPNVRRVGSPTRYRAWYVGGATCGPARLCQWSATSVRGGAVPHRPLGKTRLRGDDFRTASAASAVIVLLGGRPPPSAASDGLPPPAHGPSFNIPATESPAATTLAAASPARRSPPVTRQRS